MKIFKGTRKKLLKEQNLSKYLLYATGEIILVVIGILIALAASNYSEQKKAENQSRSYLQNMVEDLSTDTLYLAKMIEKIENQLVIEEWLRNKHTFSSDDLDSIKLAVSNINWIFNINDRSFQNIQNAADAKLLGYEQLYSDISKYYIVTKARIARNNDLEIHMSQDKSVFEQVVHKNLLITTQQYNDYSGFRVSLDFAASQARENAEEVMASLGEIETKNTLNEKYARHNFLYVALSFCNAEAKKLIKMINRSLKKK